MSSEQNFPISTIRHSFAHLLAQGLQRYVDANVQLGTWPSIDTGFYYDVLFSEGVEFGNDQLKELTKQLQIIAKEPQTYAVYSCPLDEGFMINEFTNQRLKNELLDKFKAQGETNITYYLNVAPKAVIENARNTKEGRQEQYTKVTDYFRKNKTISEDQAVVFIDLCGGPHVSNTKEDIDASGMVLDKLAGAYRQADENNVMMTRIYGLAFENKELLKEYQTQLEEAKKRDHRILGQQLKLFTISQLVGAGLPLLQPNGMIIREEIENYLWELHRMKWYQRVWTPHLAREELYQTSGHADKFGDELFRVQGKEDKFFMKPMNCPHHMQIFADNQFSYRDMPVRYFEPATVYRDEKTGQLSWLTRVRSITQDDGHLFCRVEQISEEVGTIVAIIKEFYTTMGMMDGYRVRFSVRWPEGKYLWSDEARDKAEGALKNAAEQYQLPYKIGVGEAAFYGPKLDFMFKDAIGRERQLATIQCDFNLPERFDLSFINEQWEKERPVVIHRAISGSLERFMGVMIEHFAGAFPVWLAPTQVIILPVADPFNEYGQKLAQELLHKWVRVQVDTDNDSLNKKIRNAEKMKIPYILVIWEKEVAENTVSVREYKSKEQYVLSADKFSEKVIEEFQQRVLS